MHRPRHSSPLAAVAVTLLVAACSGTGATPTQPAVQASESTPGGPTQDAEASTGAATDYCSIFTTDRLTSLFGGPVHVGDTSGTAGTGCVWDTADGSGELSILEQPLAVLYDDLAGQAGQHAVTGIGDKATIGSSELGGTVAGAVANGHYFTVLINPAPAEDIVVGLLRDFVSARG
jgi:Protein of unknown function (DUF3558)